MGFDIKVNGQRIQTTRSYVACCHHCNHCHHYNIDFVLFHTITFYTNSLSLCIHVNATKLPNVTFTLVATGRDIREFRVYRVPPYCRADTRTLLVLVICYINHKHFHGTHPSNRCLQFGLQFTKEFIFLVCEAFTCLGKEARARYIQQFTSN